MTNLLDFGKRLLNDEEGATAIEYGLLAALISVGIIVAVSQIGGRIAGAFSDIDTQLATQGVELPE